MKKECLRGEEFLRNYWDDIITTPKDQLMDADTKMEKFNFKTMGIGLFNLQIDTKNGGSTS